jgi:putative cell wall-binding protein
VVSPTVEAEVRARVASVTRVAGGDRYETAGRLAFTQHVPLATAIVANGERFPDALAAGPLAYGRRYPTLLTRRDVLPAATIAAIQEHRIVHVLVVGGTEAVSAAVVALLEAIPVVVTRIAGGTRYETAALIADHFRTPEFAVREVTLARGDTFPDAVAGATLGRYGAPTLFTEGPNRLGDATRAWLAAHAGQITTLRVLGDTEAVSHAVVAEALAVLSG